MKKQAVKKDTIQETKLLGGQTDKVSYRADMLNDRKKQSKKKILFLKITKPYFIYTFMSLAA